jgi:polar amino acid transport system permease protein
MAIAVPSALAVFFGGRVMRSSYFMYSYIIRGTPLLLQLFLVYYGSAAIRPQLEMIGLWGAFKDPFYAAVVVFIVNSSAYQIEIYQGAVFSVSKEQWAAAAALGLKRMQAFRLVIAPQAARVALRPLGNEVIFVFKASAIASVITVYDLMGETRVAYSRSYDFEVYLYAAAVYLVVVEIIRRAWDIADRRLSRSLLRE